MWQDKFASIFWNLLSSLNNSSSSIILHFAFCITFVIVIVDNIQFYWSVLSCFLCHYLLCSFCPSNCYMVFNRLISKDLWSNCYYKKKNYYCYYKKKNFLITRQIFVGLDAKWKVFTILLWEILPSVNIIYTENQWRKCFSKIRHSKVIFRLSALKLAKKDVWCLDTISNCFDDQFYL